MEVETKEGCTAHSFEVKEDSNMKEPARLYVCLLFSISIFVVVEQALMRGSLCPNLHSDELLRGKSSFE